jgi:hypothetical protein
VLLVAAIVPPAARRASFRDGTATREACVDVQMAGRLQRSWRFRAAMLAAAGLGVAAGDARAQVWNFQALVEPPLIPAVRPDDKLAFGAAVSVGSSPWLVVGAPDADCPDPNGSGWITDAGRVFIYKRVNGAWQYRVSFCASHPTQLGGYGQSLDASGPWIIVGSSYHGDTQGLVDLFNFNEVTQRWSRELTTTGVTNGSLGESVAIDRGLAVAGEPGHNGYRGRIRTWKLTDSTATPQPHYAPGGLVEADFFGRSVAVHSDGCELPGCTSYTDVAVALARSRLYVVKRNATTWQSSQVINQPGDAEFPWPGKLDVSHYQVVVGMRVLEESVGIGCPPYAAVRVYHRDGGIFSKLGDICPTPFDNPSTFGSSVATDRGGLRIHVGAVDAGIPGSAQEAIPATVSTFAGHTTIAHVDTVEELGIAPQGTGLNAFNDAFGRSVSADTLYMAVGAPWAEPYFGTQGVGYVAVYTTN